MEQYEEDGKSSGSLCPVWPFIIPQMLINS